MLDRERLEQAVAALPTRLEGSGERDESRGGEKTAEAHGPGRWAAMATAMRVSHELAETSEHASRDSSVAGCGGTANAYIHKNLDKLCARFEVHSRLRISRPPRTPSHPEVSDASHHVRLRRRLFPRRLRS